MPEQQEDEPAPKSGWQSLKSTSIAADPMWRIFSQDFSPARNVWNWGDATDRSSRPTGGVPHTCATCGKIGACVDGVVDTHRTSGSMRTILPPGLPTADRFPFVRRVLECAERSPRAVVLLRPQAAYRMDCGPGTAKRAPLMGSVFDEDRQKAVVEKKNQAEAQGNYYRLCERESRADGRNLEQNGCEDA